MRGRLLGFSQSREEGIISTEDGSRYTFKISDFNGDRDHIVPGVELDFIGENGVARDVFRVTRINEEKSKISAGLLAIFLGEFGAHKFYLGYPKEGLIMLLVFGFGLLMLGLPSLVIWVISLIEGIIYLTKTDEEFYNTYVRNQKPWF